MWRLINDMDYDGQVTEGYFTSYATACKARRFRIVQCRKGKWLYDGRHKKDALDIVRGFAHSLIIEECVPTTFEDFKNHAEG